jgi:hypothetical protein
LSAFLSSLVNLFYNISTNISYLGMALFVPDPPRIGRVPYDMQFNNIVQVIFSYPATVAIIVAYFLDANTIRAHTSTRHDSGGTLVGKYMNFNQESEVTSSMHFLRN